MSAVAATAAATSPAAERRIATFFGYLADAPVNPEEPPGALWRKRDFAPPANPALGPVSA